MSTGASAPPSSSQDEKTSGSNNHVSQQYDPEENSIPEKNYLSIEDYDCVGFDLDHTLCRYNIGPMIRFEYELLANFLVEKRGYDPSLKLRDFELDQDFICKGLSLDIEKGNLLRLGRDGFILAACHGTRRMTDAEIEKVYGRCRKKHHMAGYALHLQENGPVEMGNFGPMVHSFMDYFDYPTMMLCGRIVDILDQINNHGKPMDEYCFWPDVLDGMKEMFTRTQFASDQGGYFPEIKAHPDKFILKRRPEFRDWLKMLRANGKFLYVITGSHVDFASHVASYALGEDWKDLFDIVIFFARKPSFFVDRRPFWRLKGEKEVESFTGWDELDSKNCYSQGNWHDLSEFFEYATEWEPSACLYFGDNVLQDLLAPCKFTTSVDVVAVSEELLAEGMIGSYLTHNHGTDLISSIWGSYFYYPDPKKTKVLSRASSFANRKISIGDLGKVDSSKAPISSDEVKKTCQLRRVSSMRNQRENQIAYLPQGVRSGRNSVPPKSRRSSIDQDPSSCPPSGINSPKPQSRVGSPVMGGLGENSVAPNTQPIHPAVAQVNATHNVAGTSISQEEPEIVKGPARINTLWGLCIRDYAKMCIPDVDVLCDYPIDYKYPIFIKDSSGKFTSSGFFPGDPTALHNSPVTPR